MIPPSLKKDEVILMYILEGVSVCVDVITSDGKFKKYIEITRKSKTNNFLSGYSQGISEMYGDLQLCEESSMKEKIVVIAQALKKRDISYVFPINVISNMIGNIFNSKKMIQQVNHEFFRCMFQFFFKNIHIKEIDLKSISKKSKPLIFLVHLFFQTSYNLEIFPLLFVLSKF